MAKSLITPVSEQITELTSRLTSTVREMSFIDRAHMFIELSALSYCGLKQAKVYGKTIGFDNVQQINMDGGLSVTLFMTDKDIVIAFRGTYNLPNFLQDAEFTLVKDRDLPGHVHEGFIEDFNKLCDRISACIGTRHIWATGHSLGGSLAAIMAIHATRRVGSPVNQVITFGQPRIGDHEYVSKNIIPTTRFVNQFDIVPRVPTIWMGFAHFGQEVYMTKNHDFLVPNRFHTRLKRWFYSLCGLFREGISDHDVMKYRAQIIAYKEKNQSSKN